MDPIAQFKEGQKQAWATFAPVEIFTASAAPHLVKFAGFERGARLLDVGCGTGVLGIAAARRGAKVTGVDLTPGLIAAARANAAVAQVEADWREGDAEALPFPDASFDVVVSQFGHMFAPRPEVAVREMLRVLVPGGIIAFSTWPPELLTGQMFTLIGKHLPPPPGVSPPPQWGDPNIVRERLGGAVRDLTFDRATMRSPALSPQHLRAFLEQNLGPLIKLVKTLEGDPAKLATVRRELDAINLAYWDDSTNSLRQDFLMSRATKA